MKCSAEIIVRSAKAPHERFIVHSVRCIADMVIPEKDHTMKDRLGVCQWFHYEDHERVLIARAYLRELGITHLRMDVSWADYCRPNGTEWYDWLFDTLSEFTLLPTLWHTPPSLSQNGKPNGAPKESRYFAEFIWNLLERYGSYFTQLELWNEPNNFIKWDVRVDPDWTKFADMLIDGAGTAKLYNMHTILGGISPIDPGWLAYVTAKRPRFLNDIDQLAMHAFPGQWNEPRGVWGGWQGAIDALSPFTRGTPPLITETGVSVPTLASEVRQTNYLTELIQSVPPSIRVYWYTLLDLPAHYDEIEWHNGGYREPLERCLGLVSVDGRKRPAFRMMQELMHTYA